MKQKITIKVLTEQHAEAITSIVNFQDCKYPIEYAEAILTTAPQLQMLRQFYNGELIYAELISTKVKAPISLSIETSAPCIVFGYYVSGSAFINLPGDTERTIACDGQNFSMYIPDGESIWPADIGKSDLFFFVLNTEFLQKNRSDYPDLDAMIQKILTADPNAFLSGLYVMSEETKKLLLKISQFKYNTKLELEQAFLEVVCALIAQHIIQITRLKQLPYKSNAEITYAIRDCILAGVGTGTIPKLVEILGEFNIGYHTFLRSFKKLFGVTFNSFLMAEQMKLARHLLINEKLNPTAVSNQLGYAELAIFTRTFISYYGYAPIEANSHAD